MNRNTKIGAGHWGPSAGVDEATRAAVDRAFLSLASLRPGRSGDAGVIAAQRIPAGTRLVHRWHDDYYRGMVGWVALSVDQIDRLPPEQHALFRRYGLDRDFGSIFGPLAKEHVVTLDNFINHSCEANLGYDEQGSVVTTRDLGEGEELFLDYGAFVVNYDEPFLCECGAPVCRRRITRRDWEAIAANPARTVPPFVRRRLRR